jgi:hypothetical protein
MYCKNSLAVSLNLNPFIEICMYAWTVQSFYKIIFNANLAGSQLANAKQNCTCEFRRRL